MAANGSRRKDVSESRSQTKPKYSALILARDSMSSELLADALIRGLGYDAIPTAPSQFLQVLGTRAIDLLAISADVDGKPGLGFEIARSAACRHPEIPIVMLLDMPTQANVISAIRCGARGLFGRHRSMSEFFHCVEYARRGYIWAGGDEANYLLKALRNIPAPPDSSSGNGIVLTAREAQVVRHAATGKTNKIIAREMKLSEHTVKNYLFRAFEKLGVSSRVELLFYLTMSGVSMGSTLEAPEPSPLSSNKRIQM